MLSTFECFKCGEELQDELPHLLHIEAWPTCCGEETYLMEVGDKAGEGEIRSPRDPEIPRLPFPGPQDPTPSGG